MKEFSGVWREHLPTGVHCDAPRTPITTAQDREKLKGAAGWSFVADSKSALTITFTAEVSLHELLKEGPEAFAKRVRELLEAAVEPLLQLRTGKG